MAQFWIFTKNTVKEALICCFEPVFWILRKIKPPKVSRKITTKHFKDFKDYWKPEYEKKNIWHSDDDFLCLYVLRTKRSPFLGDDDLVEIKKFLKENNIELEVRKR